MAEEAERVAERNVGGDSIFHVIVSLYPIDDSESWLHWGFYRASDPEEAARIAFSKPREVRAVHHEKIYSDGLVNEVARRLGCHDTVVRGLRLKVIRCDMSAILYRIDSAVRANSQLKDEIVGRLSLPLTVEEVARYYDLKLRHGGVRVRRVEIVQDSGLLIHSRKALIFFTANRGGKKAKRRKRTLDRYRQPFAYRSKRYPGWVKLLADFGTDGCADTDLK